jgi:GMP synthase (glutamine-hydrolysing)
MTMPRALRVLLVQIRDAGDPMATHERECVARRIGTEPVELLARNGLVDEASVAWLDGADALVIGGSGSYSVHHPESARWVEPLRKLLDGALHRGLPGFGVCFGHQLLGHHLGRRVITDDEHAELGTIEVSLTADGERDEVFSAVDPSFVAHTGHSDHVDGVPEGVDLMASSEQLTTQAFRVRGAPFFTTQFHPDLSGAEAVCRYLAYKRSLAVGFTDEQATLAASKFRPGADVAVALLGRFVELVAQRSA